MSEYVPSTEGIRELIAAPRIPNPDLYDREQAQENLRLFDRWLADELSAAERRGAIRALRTMVYTSEHKAGHHKSLGGTGSSHRFAADVARNHLHRELEADGDE